MRQHGYIVMRIGSCITMAWKVFGRGNNTPFLQAAHIGQRLRGYRLAVLAERAEINDRIVRVIIHVDNRCVIDMHTHALALLGDLKTHFLDERVVALNRAERHLIRIANR